MTAPLVQIVNVATGKVIEREINADELAQVELDRKATDAQQKEQLIKQAARQSALDKLAALGLSVEEISAITGA